MYCPVFAGQYLLTKIQEMEGQAGKTGGLQGLFFVRPLYSKFNISNKIRVAAKKQKPVKFVHIPHFEVLLFHRQYGKICTEYDIQEE